MDLSTTYLGLKLAHPLMPGASPLVDQIDTVKQLEDAGASAIVMHSLFEEQIRSEQLAAQRVEALGESFAEALSYFPRPDEYRLGPDKYLEQVALVKKAVGVPVISSLNGVTAEGWLDYAKLIEQAGADALELNVFFVATDPNESGESVERRLLEIVRMLKPSIGIPLAVKLSPFFSSMSHLARQLDGLGADGLVLFNRFYQPDIDLEALETVPKLFLSDSAELLLRVRWLAILHGQVKGSLAVTGGVHTPVDAIKAIMAGADGVQVVSALLHHGPSHLRTLIEGLRGWMEEHEYESVQQMKGSMSLVKSPDPAAFSRGNYMRMLQTWRP